MNDDEIAQLDDENQQRSLRRTQKNSRVDRMQRIWLVWHTYFAPDKIDRYDDKAVKSAMKNWLNNQRKHSRNDVHSCTRTP